MPQNSSDILLYDTSGNPLVVGTGTAVPVSVLPVGGSDGTNARFLTVDTSGRLVIVQATAANLNATVTQGPGSGAAATFWYSRVTDGTNTMPTGDAVARAIFQKVTDGTNTAAVKAASTAPVATDPALVVAISPNSPVTITPVGDATAAGTLGALNAAVQIATAGYSTVGFQLAAGTLIGTLVAEVSFDGGTTWVATYFDTANGGKASTIVFASSNTATAATIVGVGGSGLSRVRVSAYTSGTANVTVRATTRQDPSTLTGGIAGGSLPPAVTQVGGSDGTLLRTIRTATDGTVRVDPTGTTTQPISGTVTSNIGTTNGLALDATLTGGTAKAIVRGGAKGATTAADVTGTAEGADHQAIDVQIYHGGTAKDPTAIRALTSTDVVTAAQGTAAAVAGGWPVKVTDGTNTMPTMDVVARAAFHKVTDGTNTATVKAASTAAVATDPALVVALSPNNPISLSPAGDATATGALGALNAAVQVATAGYSTVGFQLAAGTLIGTIVAEVSFDGGTTWVATYLDTATSGKLASVVFASSNVATAATIVGVGGSGLSRLRVSAYTSGTANVTVRATSRQDPSTLTGGIAGGALPPAITQMGGSDGTLLRAIRTATDGTVRVDPTGTTTQPVSGTVTANQGTAAAVAGGWPVKVTDGTNTMPTMDVVARAAFHKLTDGTNTAAVKAASTAAVATDPALVIAVSPNSGLALDASISAQSLADNSAYTDGTTKVQPVGFIFDEVAGTALTENDAAAARIDSKRAQVLVIEDGTTRGVRVAVKAASIAPVAADPAMVVAVSPNSSIQVSASGYTSFIPNPQSDPTGSTTPLVSDSSGSLQIRGPVLSDEGSLRDDFSGSGLTTAITGTLTFTNGSTTVTGSGTVFQTELTSDHYIKKTADVEADYVRIASVDSNTSITLLTPYIGTTASTTGVSSRWATTATGGTVTVATSEVLLVSSTASGNIAQIAHLGDYPPYTLNFKARITQRIANQTGTVGFQDNPTTPTKQAVVIFDGAGNTSLKFRTSFSAAAAEIQETVVQLTTGLDTSQSLQYQIDLSANTAVLSINGGIVATHSIHIPGPYDEMYIVALISNAAIVTTTTLALDTIFFQNLDQLQVTNSFTGEPLKVIVVPTANTAVFGIRDGSVATAAATLVPIRTTTYTEQLTNAQRSIVSSSALDAAAGTGAQTVRITYLDVLMAGPFTETVTLNGVTAVNTVGTNICFIEKIEVVTSGTVNANAGTITLKAAVAGGGATIGTINVGDNRTFWAHHYTPNGKTTNITVMTAGAKATSGNVFIRTVNPILAASTEIQITETFRTTLGAPSFPRSYISPIQISGPSRLIMYMLPDSATASTTYGSFDFYDQ